jgi:hypothetical protein
MKKEDKVFLYMLKDDYFINIWNETVLEYVLKGIDCFDRYNLL